MYGKNNMEIYITICKIDSQWEFAVWFMRFKRALYQSRGMGWAEDGREVHKGGAISLHMADSC